MSPPGPKPKTVALRIVDGTHRADRHVEPEIAAAGTFGGLVKPAYLKGEAAKAWKRYIEPAGWLDASREAAAISFCELWQEFRDGPRAFPAAKHGQMRAYMGELGLTDERNRSLDAKPEDDDGFA